ncbi:MAG: hypothetical protein HY040_22235 [Planctomycetes bacterium]|nr:hypothetical protein [Planctomycetota bacterium]
MPVIIQCPSCESRLKVAEDKRGKKINCPKCEYGFKVDSGGADYHADDPDSEDRPRARRADADDEERGEVRIRSKKKGKKKQASSRWLWIAGSAGGGAVVLGLLIWAAVMFLGGAPPAQPITTWEKYTSSEQGEFGFVYPADWHEKSYGIKDRREVEITGPGASITIKESIGGSLLGDIAGGLSRGGPDNDELSPVAQVHEARRPDTKGYEEKPAKTVMARHGKVRRSAYAQGSKRGYRVTMLMNLTALDIYCECRASDWATLRPAFERFIESLGRGAPP